MATGSDSNQAIMYHRYHIFIYGNSTRFNQCIFHSVVGWMWHHTRTTPWLMLKNVPMVKCSGAPSGHRWGANLPLLGHWTCILLSLWPMTSVVTFSAERLHYSLTGTKLYCVVTEAHVCEEHVHSHYANRNTEQSNR